MTKAMRQKLIAAITFLSGLYFFLEFVLPEKIGEFQFNKYSDQISQGITVVGVMALGLGIINVVMVHGSKIVRSQRGWQNSLILITGMVVMFVFEGIDMIRAEQRLSAAREFFNLATFVERIDSDYVKNRFNPKPRIEALQKRLTEINANLASPDSMFVPPADAPLKVRNTLQDLRSNIEGVSASLTGLDQSIMHDRPELAQLPAESPAGSPAEATEPAATEKAATAAAPAPIAPAAAEAIKKLKGLGAAAQELSKISYEGRLSYKLERLIKEGLFSQLGAAMFSLLAFYIANAAYRSFRIRSKEAALMMLAALIVMLGQIPHGPLYISTELPAIRIWLLKNINTPVNRAIFFGSAIAGLAMSVRLWLSLERSPLSQDTDASAPDAGAAKGGV